MSCSKSNRPADRGSFSDAQVKQLLKAINEKRVLRDGKNHSHVSQQDILAHLIRVFGFGNFDIEVIECELVRASERVDARTGELNGRWDATYRALVRLSVRNENGQLVQVLENGSMGTAQNQSFGDAHDLAYKSAISLSVKRAAIGLGDQFGLSLYNKGQLSALVKQTIVGEGDGGDDIQSSVDQQLSLGNDEIDRGELV